MRTLVADIIKNEGGKVTLQGWVDVRRDHGKLIFIDIRDASGVCQVVFIGKDKDLYQKANLLRSEWVVEITGQVNKRPDTMVNKDIATGSYEVLAEDLKILNESATPPFDLATDGYEVNEEVRMKYRYLDVRRKRLQRNLRVRSKLIQFITNFLVDKGFVYIETPVLTKSTPEGARDYLVPSRVYPGHFYALPQSPQQYKQLLMVGGLEKYFQIARCFRDEDTRGDRQPEFTQLDIEMSFTSQEEILQLTEELMIELIEVVFPDKKIAQKPFPRLTWQESQDQYGSDKPDLRKDKNDASELAFAWVLDFPLFEKNKEGKITSAHHPFTAPNEADAEYLETDPLKVRAWSYDLVLNGYELGSGSIRIHDPKFQKKIFEILGLTDSEIQQKFGHLIEAFGYGAPPMGGIAPGIDRLLMILCNEPNIREVIAFPKTGDGRDVMMDAPSEADKKQLSELGLEIKKKN